MKIEDIEKRWSEEFHSRFMRNSILEELDFAKVYMPRLLAAAKAAQYLLHHVNRDYAQWKIPLEKALEELEKE